MSNENSQSTQGKKNSSWKETPSQFVGTVGVFRNTVAHNEARQIMEQSSNNVVITAARSILTQEGPIEGCGVSTVFHDASLQGRYNIYEMVQTERPLIADDSAPQFEIV